MNRGWRGNAVIIFFASAGLIMAFASCLASNPNNNESRFRKIADGERLNKSSSEITDLKVESVKRIDGIFLAGFTGGNF